MRDSGKLEVSKVSNTVSRLVVYCKSLISYGPKPTVTKTSHPRFRGVTDPDPVECLGQVDRLVRSPLLQGSESLCKLLQYLAHHTLNSPADHLKEYRIATEVLGRPADFDPQSDSSVRTQIGRLRTKLIEYYNSVGIHDPILIDVPKGRYALSFERKAFVADQEAVREVVTHPPAPASSQHRWTLAILPVTVLALGCCAALWVQNRGMEQSMHAMQETYDPLRQKPTVAALWSNILGASPDTDIILGDESFGLIQVIDKRSFSFDDYLSRRYVSQLQAQNLSPDMHAALGQIASWHIGNTRDFELARHILALDPPGKKIHLYNARDYTPDLIKQDNVILIGSTFTNPWGELFESRLNFIVKFDNNGVATVTNRVPFAGEQKLYTATWSASGYCVVAYLPSSYHNGSVVLIEGTDAEATEAGGNFLLSEDKLVHFQKMLHANKLPYFEALFKIFRISGTPLTATIEAYRTYPNLH